MTTGAEVLAVEMLDNDAGALTIRGYLKALLFTLWDEEDGFSGKRPFGNSGWQYEVYTSLINVKMVKGKLDSDGYVDEVDDKHADELIRLAIEALH